MNPLVSVIIPTANRPQYLPRAVQSALAGMKPGEVEVIVVPNGTDQSWRKSLKPFLMDQRVVVSAIERGHACAARNHGLSIARGQFVRFLDDDDYLYPEAAAEQYSVALAGNADICSGAVDIVNEAGHLLRVWLQPRTSDFVVSTLTAERVTQPTAHVFQRIFLENQCWDETLSIRQDTDWMIRLCYQSEINWVRLDQPMGVWVQHDGGRISRGTDPGQAALQHTAENILSVIDTLQSQHSLSFSRMVAASDGLWSAVQKGFLYEPRYWIAIAKKARALAPNRKPPSGIYHLLLLRRLNPLLIIAAIAPVRWIYLRVRNLLRKGRAHGLTVLSTRKSLPTEPGS